MVISCERSARSGVEVTTRLLATLLAPFVQERPLCVMARAVWERLLEASRLDALLARTAQQP